MDEQFTMVEAEKLDEALAMMAAGVPLEEVLIGSGSDAGWLEPLLQAAQASQVLRATIPVPSPQASLQRMMARRDQLIEARPGPVPPISRPASPGAWSWLRSWGWIPQAGLLMATVILVVLVSSLAGGGLVLAAERSLPGEPLYGMKRLGETIRLTLAGTETRREQLAETFNDRRKTEARALLVEGERALVTFSGTVTAVTTTRMTVDGLELDIDSQTELVGPITNGAEVRVRSETQPPDMLRAIRVEVLTPGPAIPTPLPPVTPRSEPTPSPTATASPTPAPATGQSSSDTIELPPTPLSPAPVAGDDSSGGNDEPKSNENESDDDNDNRNDDASNDGDDSDDRNDNDDDDNNNRDDGDHSDDEDDRDDGDNSNTDDSSDDRDDDGDDSSSPSLHRGDGTSGGGDSGSNDDDNSGKGSSDDDDGGSDDSDDDKSDDD